MALGKCTAVALVLFVAGAAAHVARGDALVLPKLLQRDRTITAIYRLAAPTTGQGVLDLEWTDADGRIVERRTLPVALAHARQFSFRLNLRRAVVLGNHLHAHLALTLRGDGAPRRQSAADADFAVPPAGSGWNDYQVIMWQPRSPSQYGALKALGVTAGMVYAGGKDDPRALAAEMAAPLHGGLGWYVENIATDFYSAYHRWSPGRPVNWRFAAVKQLYQKNRDDPAALMRDPSLSDPRWLDRIRRRLVAITRQERPYRPLYYSLGDETGIAELSVAWDFDLSPASLAGMRAYLKRRYGSLGALDRAWRAHFAAWDQVFPLTTRQAMRRGDGDFAGWADFKEWMDVAFARAVRHGTDAVHAADPDALAAIEGAQDSGWGGYDYARLATAVDLAEVYDDGENLAALRSFNPKLVTLTTANGGGPQGIHDLWREFLRGTRGVVLWDPNRTVVRGDGSPGAWGRELAPTLAALRGGLGALLIASTPGVDPVAILYSPASLRTRWLLDWQPWGDAWSDRDATSDYDDANAVRTAMIDTVQALWRRGVAPRFLSDRMVAKGGLRRAGCRVLVLPETIALSPEAARAIRDFVARGGTVVAAGEPGQYDQHSRKRARPQLADLFAPAPQPAARSRGGAIRLAPEALGSELARLVDAAGAGPGFALASAGGAPTGVEVHHWRDGAVTLLAVQRDLGAAKPAPAARDAPIVLSLRHAAYVYDLRRRTALGRRRRVTLSLDPVTPTVLAIVDRPLPRLAVAAPGALRRGALGQVTLRFAVPSPAAAAVAHVSVVRPDGMIAGDYSGNLVLRGGTGVWRLPLALNDATGAWQIVVTDVLSGRTVTRQVAVR